MSQGWGSLVARGPLVSTSPAPYTPPPSPPPPAPGCVPTPFEDFNRTVSGAWGTATPGGQTWVIGNGSDGYMFSVDGSEGVIAHDSGSPQMTVTDAAGPWSQPEWDMLTEFTLGAMSSGQSDYLQYSMVGGGVRSLDFWLATDGTGYIGLDGSGGSALQHVAFVSGSTYKVKWHYIQATGDSMAKVWLASDPEPTRWMVTDPFHEDDGAATGFKVGLSSKNPSSGFTYTHHFGDIEFDSCPHPPEPTPFDAFERSVSQWGTATSGYVWTQYVADAPDVSASVDGDVGRIDISIGATVFTGINMKTGGGGSDPWNAPAWTMFADGLKLFWGDLSGDMTCGFAVQRPDLAASVFITIFSDGTAQGTDTVPVPLPFVLTSLVTVNVRWEVSPGAYDRFKIWPQGDIEPSAWLYESAPPTIVASDAMELQVSHHSFNFSHVALSGLRRFALDLLDFS